MNSLKQYISVSKPSFFKTAVAGEDHGTLSMGVTRRARNTVLGRACQGCQRQGYRRQAYREVLTASPDRHGPKPIVVMRG
jgi:hypothetical protein